MRGGGGGVFERKKERCSTFFCSFSSLSLSFSFRIFHLFLGRNDSSFISREKKTKKIFSSWPLKAKSLGVLVDGETVAPFQEAR